MVAKEIALGDRKDLKNAFRWDEVKLNLPGSSTYDPSLHWVFKIRWSDGKIAADLFIYVDDGRVTSSNKLELSVFVSQEKWDKTKLQVKEIAEELSGSTSGSLKHKALERKRGFLFYVTRTYPTMVPYLKGIHLTLDAWRPGRDDEGWKSIGYKGEAPTPSSQDAPEYVKGVPRLKDDLAALSALTASESPPIRRVRSKRVMTVFYGFGDASAVGFCSTFQRFSKQGSGFIAEDKIHYRYGH
ncbi:unnamed protein product [Cylindrotheca closterium]|uniref:Uncharacterized protein n=1 Tax=Cylindrotheca closterium TaxID=2856 RepID=A0AAD2CDX7_9STRA|nr:unnamed protein product [Cylindrotheca closterium]